MIFKQLENVLNILQLTLSNILLFYTLQIELLLFRNKSSEIKIAITKSIYIFLFILLEKKCDANTVSYFIKTYATILYLKPVFHFLKDHNIKK